MGMVRKGALRLACSACLAALTACSGGGGGGNTLATNTTTASNTTSGNTTSGNTTSGNTTSGNTASGNTTSNTTPTFAIGPLGGTGTFGSSTPIVASGSAPNFSINLPAVGTVFPLYQATAQSISTGVTDTTAQVGGGTATFQGTVTTNGNNYPIIELKVPGIGLDAANLHADGTITKLSDGSTVSALTAALNYTIFGSWSYAPTTSAPTAGIVVTGYQTPTSGVPTSGSANYNGNGPQGAPSAGGVSGAVFVPATSSGVNISGLAGQASANVNFGTGAVTGSLTNMKSFNSDGSSNPWNAVNLTGTLSGAAVSGTTSTTGAPSGAGTFGMSSAATGKFSGALYGPNAQELGAIWSLNDPTAAGGGKAAWGVVGATAATGNTTSGNTTSGNTTPTVSIGAPDDPSAGLQTQPVYNFTTNLPPVGTGIGLPGPAVKITSTTVSAAGINPPGVASPYGVYRGMGVSNGSTYPIFDLTIPALSVTASNLRGNGNPTTLADGSTITATFGTLTYTLLGLWAYVPAAGGTTYLGMTATGSTTPAANVPTVGSATYSGTGSNGGVVGSYYVPSGTGTVAGGALQGNLSVTANFATNAINGSMTSMTASPAGGGASTPWNDVSLSGSISRSAGSVVPISGTTATGTAPAGAGNAGFSGTATGKLSAGFFGPNGEEIGGTWTLTDPTAAGGGKTALGTFAGTATTTP